MTSNISLSTATKTLDNWTFGTLDCLVRHQRPVRIRPAIAEELPGVSHLANHFQIQIGNDQCVLSRGASAIILPARIAEITLPVKLADVPGLFVADAIDGADEVTIGDRMGRLFQLPKILGETSHRG